MKGVIDVRTNEKQKEEIKKIAKIWEDALLNADITDENARINKEIYYGLKANLTFAYIVTEQFEKARKFYNDLIEHNSDLLDMKDAVNDLTTLFSLYQGSYNRMYPDFDLNKILPGEWEVVAITTNRPVDYNKDGNKSTNLLAQYDKCKRYLVFKFFDTKKLTTIEGNEKDGCKPKIDDELFWATKYQKSSGWKSLFIGDEENFELYKLQ
jgi:hypothetical protein